MKTTLLAAVMIVALLATTVHAQDTAPVLNSLKEFYDASVAQDIDRYIKSQDQQYLDLLQQTQNTDYKSYFQAAWKLTTTKDYSIVDPHVNINDSMALVFYELKADVVLTDTQETKQIDNSMVALLVNTAGGWKVRYTILQSLYDEKIVQESAAITAMDYLADSESNVTLKQELKAAGTYPDEKKFDTGQIPADAATAKGATAASGGSYMMYIIIGAVVLVVIIAIVIVSSRKKKHA